MNVFFVFEKMFSSIPMFCFWENVLFSSHVLLLRKCSLQFPCFAFEKMFSSIPMLPVMLLAHEGKGSNSCSQVFSKTGALKNFAILTGKNLLCWSIFLIKFQDWRPAFLFKKRLQRRCFFVNIAKFLRTAFLLKTCLWYYYKFLFDDR